MPSDAHTLTVRIERGTTFAALPNLAVRLRMQGGEERKAALGLRPLRIGTSPDCDLVCEDPLVSRVHCELSVDAHGVLLQDLGSKNGTYVAGLRIRQVYLRTGTEVALGGSTLRLLEDGGERTIPLSPRASFGAAVGGSIPMRALFEELGRAAEQDVPVLLWGESGSGKDLLARAIHEHSPRAEGPLVVFDCASTRGELAAATLFGAERGAFTGADTPRRGLFEEAHGGTLLLDEVAELPLDVQPLLLRALEEGKVRRLGGHAPREANVRVIATTQRELRERMAAHTFRQDLFFRLAGVEAWVPPLRDRRDDIPLLCEKFLAALDPPRTLADLPARALELFATYDWPGNVRELRNVVQRALVLPELELGREGDGKPLAGPVLTYREAREAAAAAFERRYVEDRLRHHGGNVAAAAEEMGVSRQFVYRLITRHDLKLPRRE